MIVNLYWTRKASIRLEKNPSDEIPIKRGVIQRCVLSPCLFNLYTETIFGHIEDSKGVTIGGTQINNLRYADDTVLLADSEENLQKLEGSQVDSKPILDTESIYPPGEKSLK